MQNYDIVYVFTDIVFFILRYQIFVYDIVEKTYDIGPDIRGRSKKTVLGSHYRARYRIRLYDIE